MTIRPLSRAEVGPAVSLAARAFVDDPLFAFLYPDPATREQRFTVELGAGMRWQLLPLGVAEADEALRGIALWERPGVRVPAWRQALVAAGAARAVGVRRLPLVLRAYQAFDDAKPEGAYWYLALLVVEPDAQGQGVGGALLRRGLDRADRDELPAYLETGTAANVAFYERFGFTVRSEIALPGGGPTHWGLWREPSG